MSKISSRFALSSALFLAFSGCSDATGPAVQIPAVLTPSDGDLQTAVVGTAVAKAPTVRVLDDKNAGVPGVVVTFAVATGGGTITGATDTTDATGTASVGSWTLGTAPGTNSLTATSGSLTATITATATVGRAFSITPVAGKDQSATVGSNVATAPAVAVRDTFANPIAGATVTFAVASGGGSITGGTATSDANGIATLGSWKLGTTVGANSIVATAVTLSTTIAATAVAGPPAQLLPFPVSTAIEIRAANSVSNGPSVQLTDAFNNPTPGVTVTFSVGTSGGTIGNPTQVTNQNGVASIAAWTLGSQPGDYSVTAAFGTMSAVFHATATAAPPAFSPPASASALRFSVLSTGIVGQSGAAYHTCALDTSGNAYCWGSNSSGELGDGTTVSSSVPVRVTGGLTFVSLAGGTQHTCGLTAAGAAYCWGSNNDGALGDGTFVSSRSVPTAVSGGLTFTSIAAGYNFACALTLDGKAYCWGEGFLGRMGNGGQTDARTPTAVSGGLSFTSLAVGFGHACGLTSDGKAYCWGGGAPYWGQLGNGVPPAPDPRPADDPLYVRMSTTPIPVSGGLTFTQLAAGFNTTCGLEISGKVYCWGLNTWGALGDGTNIARGVPTAVLGSPGYVSLAMGGYHICGRLQSGAVRCSGANFYGQFGNGYLNNSYSPIDAAMGMTFVNIAAGDMSGCGIDSSQKIYCWGNNDYGQLGDGTTTRRTTPVPVIFP